jgi:hypothetical protein
MADGGDDGDGDVPLELTVVPDISAARSTSAKSGSYSPIRGALSVKLRSYHIFSCQVNIFEALTIYGHV